MRNIDGISPHKKNNQNIKPIDNIGHNFVNVKKHIKLLSIMIFTLVVIIYTSMSFYPIKDWVNLIRLTISGRYLILFQNNTELRPSGGFVGSFASVDTGFYHINNLQINTNIYKLDDKYDYVMQIDPPDPIKAVTNGKYWAMRDANWSPDFPTSAKQVAWFYNEEGGSKVDGVVSINATVISELLKITGPIDLPEHNVTVDSDNFFDILHSKIEKEYFTDPNNALINEPKTILNDLKDQMLAELVKTKYWKKVYLLLINQSKENHIQLYSNNSIIEKTIKYFGLGGEVKNFQTPDYLSINNANLGGLKSSLNVTQQVIFNSFVDENGNITNNLSIKRNHQGNGEWPDGDNNNYTRIMIPGDSVLISASIDDEDITSKIDINQENDKTIFGFWFSTPSQQSRLFKISYRLKNSLNNIEKYKLYWQKQSGVISDDLKVIVNGQTIYDNPVRTNLEIM